MESYVPLWILQSHSESDQSNLKHLCHIVTTCHNIRLIASLAVQSDMPYYTQANSEIQLSIRVDEYYTAARVTSSLDGAFGFKLSPSAALMDNFGGSLNIPRNSELTFGRQGDRDRHMRKRYGSFNILAQHPDAARNFCRRDTI
ncbi:hypothetical protein SBOR_3000 [Sclerotinia borealis F-4128]|uniref:Uncharacterized protein n=1 Tax=Sclerotinia borealis (strain F-4128) TaxID=1432307 RepID=W9CKU8_SCLBF|nr:hypothetical protein SBOR_3000 [Sclerotinia borealis F-4128]